MAQETTRSEDKTPEGLTIVVERHVEPDGKCREVTREIGRGNTVIFETTVDGWLDDGMFIHVVPWPEEGLRYLLRTIVGLDRAVKQLQASLGPGVDSMELFLGKTNRKLAKKRLRRYIEEHALREVTHCSGDEERQVMNEVLAKVEFPAASFERYEEDDRWLEWIENYFSVEDAAGRESRVTPILVPDAPYEVTSMLVQARKAFVFGLFDLVAPASRAALEAAVDGVLRANDPETAIKLRREEASLAKRIEALGVAEELRLEMHRVRRTAGGVLHRGTVLGENGAAELLASCRKSLEKLYGIAGGGGVRQEP